MSGQAEEPTQVELDETEVRDGPLVVRAVSFQDTVIEVDESLSKFPTLEEAGILFK